MAFDVAQERCQVLLRGIKVASQRQPRSQAAQGAVGNADAIRGATDTAVARHRACEELGQRRGWDHDALRRRGVARTRATTRGGIAAGAERVFDG
jgi:hypothetical protein